MTKLKYQRKFGLQFGKSFRKVVIIKLWAMKPLSLWVFSEQIRETIKGQRDDMRDFAAYCNNQQLLCCQQQHMESEYKFNLSDVAGNYLNVLL